MNQREGVTMTRLQVGFLVALAALTFAKADAADSESTCRRVIQKSSALTKCGFVTDRSGAQYYWLEYDTDVLQQSAEAPDADPASKLMNQVVSVPVFILATDTEHPFASVRIEYPNGSDELTRSEYRECFLLFGDPLNLMKEGQEKQRGLHFECILNKLQEPASR